ncbi:MAG: hypothetical protein M1827_002991 [Pycnora praestabilis]|nr:MAG: hypothetical protein M1827_002991 [Pycnora praestabilis]
MTTMTGMTGLNHGHVVPTPRWILGIRIAQVVLALLILALVAYSTSVWGGTYMDAAYGINIFTAIATFIIVAYVTLSPMMFPHLYNMWAVLAAEIFAVLWWLIAFAILASWSSSFTWISYDDWFYKRDTVFQKRDNLTTAWQTGAAASGLGGLEFILFIITLVMFGLSLHRQRRGVTNREHQAAPPYQSNSDGTQNESFAQDPKYEMQPMQSQQQIPPQQQFQSGMPQQQYQPDMPQQQQYQHGMPPQHEYHQAPEVHQPQYA